MRPDGFTAQLIRALARDQEPFAPEPAAPGGGFGRQVIQSLARRPYSPTATSREPLLPPTVRSRAAEAAEVAREFLIALARRSPAWRMSVRWPLVRAARLLTIARRLAEERDKLRDADVAVDWSSVENHLRGIQVDAPQDENQLIQMISVAADLSERSRRSVSTAIDFAIEHAIMQALHIYAAIKAPYSAVTSADVPRSAALAEAEDAAKAAAYDFAGADLRDAELTAEAVDGVIWSSTTQWPEGVREEIENNSIPRGNDTFEVHFGGVGARGDEHLLSH